MLSEPVAHRLATAPLDALILCNTMSPKAFISYSWTNQAHQSRVQEWADRLLGDGVDVILDLYDFKEGQDKNHFMERMVSDSAVTHVLVISDKSYAEKADSRTKGVGTESQIISQEVYDKVDQSKFIPIVCEFDNSESPYLPVFLKSRKWIDFSTPEAVNGNWEQLVRLLFGKPLYQKPAVGKPPAYLQDNGPPSSPATGKLLTLKQAVMLGRPAIDSYRSDFLDSCLMHADALRPRTDPERKDVSKWIVETWESLSVVRDQLVDWINLESTSAEDGKLSESMSELMERLLELRCRPPEVQSWSDWWYDAHRAFVYEFFLYAVASLLRGKRWCVLNHLFTSHYIKPEAERHRGNQFDMFDRIYFFDESLNEVLAVGDRKFIHPVAEQIKRQANRRDTSFEDLVQADLLSLLMSLVTPGVRWYPQTLVYARFGDGFPFFIRAAQRRHFRNLSEITGHENADSLRIAVKEGFERLGVNSWRDYRFDSDFAVSLNVENWDTLS